MLQLVLTHQAQNSLEDIISYYLTNYSSARAEKVVQSIDKALERIAQFPHSFTVCFDIEPTQQNIRQIMVHNTFKIIYRIGKEQIEVLEIFHGSRNPEHLKNLI